MSAQNRRSLPDPLYDYPQIQRLNREAQSDHQAGDRPPSTGNFLERHSRDLDESYWFWPTMTIVCFLSLAASIAVPIMLPHMRSSSSCPDGWGRRQVIVLLGGADNASATDQVTAFDPRTLEWIRLEPLLDRRHSLSAVTTATNRLYTFGGWDSRNRFVREVTVFGGGRQSGDRPHWSDCEAMKWKRAQSSAAILNEAVYVAGGMHETDTEESVYLPVTERFNTTLADRLDSPNPGTPGHRTAWSVMANMTKRRAFFTLNAYRGHLYAVGGDPSELVPSIERYDAERDQWTLTDLSRDLYFNGHAAVVYESSDPRLDGIYLIGGHIRDRELRRNIYKSDLEIIKIDSPGKGQEAAIGSFRRVGSKLRLRRGRFNAAAALLELAGEVLVFVSGGMNDFREVMDTMEVLCLTCHYRAEDDLSPVVRRLLDGQPFRLPPEARVHLHAMSTLWIP